MNFEKLTDYIDSLQEQYGIPCADMRITKGHQVVYRHMTGVTDFEGILPVNEETIYRLFSASKVITMTAVDRKSVV